MMSKNHYFIELNKNPWPILTSLGTSNLTLALLIMMKYSTMNNIKISMLMLLTISLSWWMIMKSELNKKGDNTKPLENSFKVSMALFISSEILFFVSMFWAYQHFNLVPEMEIGASWPPLMVKMFDSFSIPMLNTTILLSSGVTVTLAHKKMMKKNKNGFMTMMLITTSMGLLFSILQYQEYKNSYFSMTDSTFGTTFFLITGFHGIHVLIGSLFLMSNTVNHYRTNIAKESLSFEMAAWYWHFVDVVWMFVFYMIYYLNN